MLQKRKQQSTLVQILDLFLIELTNWRWSWRTQLVTSIVAPLLGIVGLGVFARGAGKETLAYILTGNTVMALSFGMLEKVQSHFMYMRECFATDGKGQMRIGESADVAAEARQSMARVQTFLFPRITRRRATLSSPLFRRYASGRSSAHGS
jgi:hypothetical protein